jgi:glycosyltransferase involved in cell wall biosynthesis
MTRKPLVSVVMSVYNGQRYLPASLDSILSQEGVDFEVVVVDDGSTEECAEVLSGYAGRDPRVRILRQENGGLTRALVRACAEARGLFLARQDDDDVSMPGRLLKLATVLEKSPEVAVAASWVECIGPEDESLSIASFPVGVATGTDGVLEHRRSPVHGSVMFRKRDLEAVGNYRPQFYFAQDSDLWFRLAARGGFLFVPEVLYRLRIAEGSISARHRESQLRLYGLARECWRARTEGRPEGPFLEEAMGIRPGRTKEGRTKKGEGTYFIGRTLLRNGDPRALGYLRSYVRQSPFDPKGWISVLQAAFARRGRGVNPAGRVGEGR